MITIQDILSMPIDGATTVSAQGKVTYIRPWTTLPSLQAVREVHATWEGPGPVKIPEPLGGAFLGLKDASGAIQLLCHAGGSGVLPLYDKPNFRGDVINLRIDDTIDVSGTLRLTEKGNRAICPTRLSVVERRTPLVIHLVTQRNQPYGSERRCCERCGVMTILPNKVLCTDDWDAYDDPKALSEAGLVACS